MTLADLLAAMPLLILAVAALLVLLAGAVKPGRSGTTIGIAALTAAGIWAIAAPAPPGAATIGIGDTPFFRFFTLFFALTAAATLLLSLDHNERREIRGEEYPATILFAAFGMVALAGATNLLIFFLGLEALTFAFYILVAIDRNSPGSAEAGLKYLILGAVAAAFIAFGLALIYAGAGTLSIAPAMQAAFGGVTPLAVAGWGFVLIGIAFKVSLVPAHLWTPDVYEGAPAPVVAFLSTGSKGASFAALLLLLFGRDPGYLREPLWVLSLLSMVVGNLAALLQTNIKRMLAYSSIAQMGYVALALLSGKGGGYESVVFYIVAYAAMNIAAFGVVAVLDRERIEEYRGIGYTRPLAGGVLALAMLGLAGIPPTAGFTGKFFIFAAAIRSGEALLAVIGILTAAVSAFYYLRVVVNLYMRQPEQPESAGRHSIPEFVALAGSSAVTVALGVYPDPLLQAIGRILVLP
ncbi:NADH-quinone oxidoreductase subunit N [Geobacter sp. DSM 9736]|uniref:NADH-quinone oxidoreductase subunit N n=1 Tax=Geobacter sp. DSM 9736 TaxID=1277350 RepID=UPI000B50B8B6|nr:NADH-quinone oxidoreductase subunit N [Geobacter sp. DSM 9736]SNB46947.1 NADH dehydrogenase subunit N [Geobacter sp. DSM 9736]